MKKLYILSILSILTFSLAFSQMLTLDHPSYNYSGSDSVNLTARAKIVNNSNLTLNLLAERFDTVLTLGHQSYFCWTVCYDPSVSISPSDIEVPAGGSTSKFEGWIGPAHISGHDEVTYRFYDMNGLSDTLYVTYKYDFGTTGINEISISKYSLNITGPNPVNTFATFTYTMSGQKDARLVISNMLGTKVNDLPLNSRLNSVVVPVSDLKSGIYFSSLVIDGKIVSSKKLIVAHH